MIHDEYIIAEPNIKYINSMSGIYYNCMNNECTIEQKNNITNINAPLPPSALKEYIDYVNK